MYLVDYHTHPYAHGENNDYNKEILQKFIQTGLKKNIKEIGFSDHDKYSNLIDWNTLVAVKRSSSIPIKKGLEFDYIPGREEEIENKIARYNLDYSIGSIHYIDGWGFDNPLYVSEYENRDIDQIYIRYYELLIKAIKSNLFNIIAHFDLIKIFAYRPEKINLLNIIKSVLKEMKRAELVLEINTNGLNKPVKEIYPSPMILEEAYQQKIPITFASDAHIPDRVGEGIAMCGQYVKDIGYKEVAVFTNRKIGFKRI